MDVDVDRTTPQAEWSRGTLAVLLLPQALSEAALSVEPARFDALVDAIAAEWNASPPGPARTSASIRWVSLVNWRVRRPFCAVARPA